jgi:hypothetical protein
LKGVRANSHAMRDKASSRYRRRRDPRHLLASGGEGAEPEGRWLSCGLCWRQGKLMALPN